MKTTTAESNFYIDVICPYCGEGQDKTAELISHLSPHELRAESCDAEIKCDNCKEYFNVIKITY